MLKLIFYVPEEHLEQVKNAVFKAGAGKYGNYAQCAWQSLGIGQFSALEGSNPYLGEQGKLTRVEEYRVETICPENIIQEVINALKNAHPYESPVYDVWPLLPYSSI